MAVLKGLWPTVERPWQPGERSREWCDPAVQHPSAEPPPSTLRTRPDDQSERIFYQSLNDTFLSMIPSRLGTDARSV